MTTKITIETDDPALIAKEAALLEGAPVSASSAPSGGTTSTPAATSYFPADPGLAPFPSPEGSMISVENGKVYLYDSSANVSTQNDSAYLRDATGGVVTYKTPLTMQGALYATDGSQVPAVLINGAQPVSWFAGDEVAICGGIAWIHTTGKWFFPTDTSGSGGNVTELTYQPAKGKQFVAAVAGSSGSTTPVMPTAPAPVSPAPGSTANVIKAGPSQTIKTLADAIAAANNGDTIQLDAGVAFKESVAISKSLRIVGGGVTANPGTAGASWSGGAKIDVTGVQLAQGKGALVPLVDCIFEGLEITAAGLTETVGGGTAGIRNGGTGNFVVRNCYIHDNQDGLFSGGYAATWLVEDNLILNNGIGDGQTHNIYFSREVVTATFNTNTSIVGPANPSAATAKGGGHAYKSRANVSNFNGGYGYAADGTVIDLPDGSTQTCNIKGVTLEKKVGDANHGVIGYASESGVQGVVGAIASGCHINTACDAPFVQVENSGVIVFDSTNTWSGNKPTANGVGTITGLPA